MKKTVLTFGLIAGIICIANFWIAGALMDIPGGMDYSMWLGYATMILAFSTIFVAIKSVRDKEQGGTITFGKGFLVGLYITLIASVMYVGGWEVYMRTKAPDFMEKYKTASIEKMKKSGMAEAELEKKIAEMEKMGEAYKNPAFRFGITFLEIFPVGLIVSLIAAGLLRKKAPETSSQ
jgi:hypothetical protein